MARTKTFEVLASRDWQAPPQPNSSTFARCERPSNIYCQSQPKTSRAPADRSIRPRSLRGFAGPGGQVLPGLQAETISPQRSRPRRIVSPAAVVTLHLFSGGKWEFAATGTPLNFKRLSQQGPPACQLSFRGNMFRQQLQHFRRDRFPTSAGALLQRIIKLVRNVFDVQCRHW